MMLPSEISVYIHWPFCLAKCPYCDFNSHVQADVNMVQWQQAYLQEIDYYKDILSGRTIKTIFIGGGTPSLAPPSLYEAIFAHLHKYAQIANDVEITLEANPTSVEAAKFAAFRAAGINRVSLGIQSLEDESLRFLGRQHSANEAKKAIAIAAQYFNNYSFDLIYARPQQTLASWQRELEEAQSLAAQHLSLYQLTIEKGTKFFNQYRAGNFTMPDNDLAADFYQLTQEVMEKKAMPAYEVSNHAKEGYECQHNLVYWRYGEYIGLGAGAHGRFRQGQQWYHSMNIHAPNKWCASVIEHGHACQQKTALQLEDIKTERLLMGMRLNEGVPAEWLSESPAVEYLQSLGLLCEKYDQHSSQKRIAATAQGRMVLNRIVAELVGDNPSVSDYCLVV